ncbi:MAG TPA: hypothetical protein VHF27_09305 [Acidimicrobiales bacterium]|nr:hypothetical protein [Acidimicrobiales bacterium]
MRSQEHRAIGDEATAAALVNVGGEAADEGFLLTFGDVVALSGDYFRPDGSRGARPPDALFSLTPVAGRGGTRVQTRDEVVCALKVMAVDEDFVDTRFQPGGAFSRYSFSPRADRTDVERRVRDRYLCLAATNDDHFVSPGRSDVPTGSGAGAAPAAYRALHQRALDEAWRLGRYGGDLSRAMAREAAAQHYLTDAFAAGHLRTPVADIRRYWRRRYPQFWERLQHRVAADTAAALREVSALLRLVPRRVLHERTDSELRGRTSQYPELSLGDLVARAFHDWDNDHGLRVDGGVVFGDGHVDEGVTRDLALDASRAGVDDVDIAFRLGRAGRSAPGPSLYEEVRRATGSPGRAFGAETRIPRLSEVNPPQNWMAADVETLWESPMVGTSGPTVGDAVVEMLRPDGEFVRQLEGLGEGLAGTHGILAAPVLGRWLAGRCCHAYHRGFVEPLARDPRPVVLALTEGEGVHRQPAMAALSLSPLPW